MQFGELKFATPSGTHRICKRPGVELGFLRADAACRCSGLCPWAFAHPLAGLSVADEFEPDGDDPVIASGSARPRPPSRSIRRMLQPADCKRATWSSSSTMLAACRSGGRFPLRRSRGSASSIRGAGRARRSRRQRQRAGPRPQERPRRKHDGAQHRSPAGACRSGRRAASRRCISSESKLGVLPLIAHAFRAERQRKLGCSTWIPKKTSISFLLRHIAGRKPAST